MFELLIIFQIKHFLADYPLQNEYMLRKFLPDNKYILPLLTHSFVHALFTFLITITYTKNLSLAFSLALLDLTIHFIVDRIKASPKLLGRFQALTKKDFMNGVTEEQKKSNKLFWWSLGLDQTAHHLTHYLIIYLIL